MSNRIPRPRSRPGRTGPALRIRSRVWALDLLAAMWVAVWIGLAVLVGIDIRDLRQISDTLGVAGNALVQGGHALQSLSHLPLVGPAISHIAGRLLSTGTSVTTAASSSDTGIEQLSYLLPAVVALVPVIPVLGVYLPVRIQRQREYKAIRRTFTGQGPSVEVERYLARRAVSTLPFHRLQQVSRDPWADLRSGRVKDLARAELERLGVIAESPAESPDATEH